MRATNDVIASSRDQVNQRAPSTTQQPVTSTRGLDRNYTRSLAVASQSAFPVPFCCLAARPHAAVNQPVRQPGTIGPITPCGAAASAFIGARARAT